MRQVLLNCTRLVRSSVHLSICLSHLSTTAAACGGFAAVGPVGRRYQLIAAWPAVSSNCKEYHVVSWHNKLNTDLFDEVLDTLLSIL